jgi:hypothetical protein
MMVSKSKEFTKILSDMKGLTQLNFSENRNGESERLRQQVIWIELTSMQI